MSQVNEKQKKMSNKHMLMKQMYDDMWAEGKRKDLIFEAIAEKFYLEFSSARQIMYQINKIYEQPGSN